MGLLYLFGVTVFKVAYDYVLVWFWHCTNVDIFFTFWPDFVLCNRKQTSDAVDYIVSICCLFVAFNIYLLGRQDEPSYELCCGDTGFSTSAQCTNRRESVLVAFAKL